LNQTAAADDGIDETGRECGDENERKGGKATV
jgi:hypothetical protein